LPDHTIDDRKAGGVTPVSVLAVAPELFPLVKTGGLADVTGALPAALAGEDVKVVTLLPGYPAVLAAMRKPEALHTWPDLFGGPARLLRGRTAGLDLMVLEAAHLYARPGNPYLGPDGRDWPDNAQRFAALGRAAADIGGGLLPAYLPDVVHGHDWQAGLVPAYLRYGNGRRPVTALTVHNLAFQGVFPASLLPVLGLPAASYSIEGIEYYGNVGFLKAGLAFADAITTVSPTYAAEIRTPEGGMGLDGLLRARSGVLHGILNGIDETVWDPASDGLIPSQYTAPTLGRRAANRRELQARLGLEPTSNGMLLGVISRLTWQKGLDMLLADIDAVLASGAQLALLGTGERTLEEGFAAAAAVHPGRVGCRIGYDEALAHLIQAGADALLVPSRFEPCGLTQLCALRYGNPPVVARVGGLADTVIDANEMAVAAGAGSGVQFAPPTRETLTAAIGRATSLWREPTVWRRMQRNAMKTDVSWRRPAARYAALYRSLLAA
jgi:starch synthase